MADDKAELINILVKSGLCSSRGDARRNIEQGGVTVAEEKITDSKATISKEQLAQGLVIRRGKKNFVRVTM